MTAEKHAACRHFLQSHHCIPKPLAVSRRISRSGRPVRMTLPERQVAAQHRDTGCAERLSHRNQKWRLRVGPGPMRKYQGVSGRRRRQMQIAAHRRIRRLIGKVGVLQPYPHVIERSQRAASVFFPIFFRSVFFRSVLRRGLEGDVSRASSGVTAWRRMKLVDPDASRVWLQLHHRPAEQSGRLLRHQRLAISEAWLGFLPSSVGSRCR